MRDLRVLPIGVVALFGARAEIGLGNQSARSVVLAGRDIQVRRVLQRIVRGEESE